MTAATLRLGANSYPVVLPSLRDPRLHLAAVIISIHLIGQVGLGFRVSVPQILVAIFSAALLEAVLAFRRTRQLVWPASAMLTGSGVGLIFRLTEYGGARWTWQGSYLFALVAAGSLLSKYVLRFRGTHLFNPSNVGLVLAFLILGSTRAEPLDFWWGPVSVWLIAAYVIILGGGIIITARLRLLAMAATFWLTLAIGLGLLAGSGHCITAAWSVGPVCDAAFWRVVVGSPEILIFLFFMITDPKTIPSGSSARIVFAGSLGILCTLLIAPMTTEFAAKVALLAGLVVLTPLRAVFDRLFGMDVLLVERLTGPATRPLGIFSRGVVVGAGLVLIGGGVVAAGAPAQKPPQILAHTPTIEVEIDRSLLPPVTVEDPETLQSVKQLDPAELAAALAEALEVERQAMLKGDQRLLAAADVGQRLAEMRQRLADAIDRNERSGSEYQFDSLTLQVTFPEGRQGGPSLSLLAQGKLSQVVYDQSGDEKSREMSSFVATFSMSLEIDGWRIAQVTSG